jgi:hypothetical protein
MERDKGILNIFPPYKQFEAKSVYRSALNRSDALHMLVSALELSIRILRQRMFAACEDKFKGVQSALERDHIGPVTIVPSTLPSALITHI